MSLKAALKAGLRRAGAGARSSKGGGATIPRLLPSRLSTARLGSVILHGTTAIAVLLSGGAAEATTSKVSEWAASGLIFKDSIELVSLDDQDVEGVTIYITDFKRSIAEKLAKDFFAEPSQASLTCAITAPINFKNPERVKGEGREIFAERKNLFNIIQNKTLRVRRVYDEKNDTLLYIAYSTRFTSTQDEGVSTGRYRTSVCALPLATAPKVVVNAPSSSAAVSGP